MAVFLINNCQFQGCGLRFTTLTELIQHIEDTHLETDVKTLEKQEMHPPASVPLSQILRISADAAKRAQAELIRKRSRAQSPVCSPSNNEVNHSKTALVLNVEPSSMQSSPTTTYTRSNSTTGSEFDEEEVSENEDSDDSWTNQEEFSSDLILSMKNMKEVDGDKPFGCPVPGCKKRYKNINGIKYHARHGHRKDARVRKGYRCHCGKSYKTPQGLRSHNINHHPAFDILSLSQQNCTPQQQVQSLQLPTQQQPPQQQQPQQQQQQQQQPPVRPTHLTVSPAKPSAAQLTCTTSTAAVSTPSITPTNLTSVSPSLAAALSQTMLTQSQLMAQLPSGIPSMSVPSANSAPSVGHVQLIGQQAALVTTAAYEK
ncbi:with another zinc finger 1-like [Octopus vulgaris]|uniref:With another zinc finger 1-like n=1 Tax=Octopus vulgaris TaxID=6645 RepID=A0AA36BIQ9_OCTVU|nr:with another zinc finger 1-like [Octopus vulgaris]